MEIFNFAYIFFVAFILDILWVWYIKSVEKEKAIFASLAGTIIYLISAVITIYYVNNPLYLIPALLGAFFGTFFAIKFKKHFNKQ